MKIKSHQSGAGQISRGFTLVELMVVVTIIAILAAIAYPSYLAYYERSCRSQAKNTLYLASQFLERFSSLNGGVYTGAVLPAGLQSSPNNNNQPGGYNVALTLTAGNPGTFVLTATRSTCPTAPNACDTTLTLNESGYKGTGNGSAGSIAACWNR